MAVSALLTSGLGGFGTLGAFLTGGFGGALGSGGAPPPISPARLIRPLAVSGYAGRDFPDLAIDADDVFAIDLAPSVPPGDALVAGSLALLFYPVAGAVLNYLAALEGVPALAGSVALQAIRLPPAARYLLGFTCDTAAGRRIALYSFFNATALPDAAS